MIANKPNRLPYIFFFVIICIVTAPVVISQTNYLSQRITLSVSNTTIPNALEEISKVSGVQFSYNVNLFNDSQLVSLNAERTSISRILDVITDGNVQYKVVGQHIILLRKEKQAQKKKEIQHYTLSGTIIDSETNQSIENVSIYSVSDRKTAITDINGTYTIKLPANSEAFAINYSKRNYSDTIIFCSSAGDLEINLSLSPAFKQMNQLAPMKAELDTPSPITELRLVNRFVPQEAIINSENIKVYESRAMQISFLPYLGSNARVSGTVTNNTSLNVLAGYTGAVNGVEIGSVLNITKRHVNGVQISGFGNITGDYSRGAQISGFFNKNTGTVRGVQISGFTNIVNNVVTGVQITGFLNKNKGTIKGVQVAGFSNFVQDHVVGAQIAGFNNNLNGRMDGAQIAGFYNYTTQNADGTQLAGFLNIAQKDVKAAQVAGFANYTNGFNIGVQIAGFGNYTRGENNGAQISGFINIADSVKGFQLAVINVSDTSSGISIGLFNHVNKGYRSFEISANDVMPLNVSYKSGTHKFYNIFTAGMNPAKTYPWGFGFGFGTLFNYKKKLSYAVELTANQILETKEWPDEVNILSKLGVTLNYKVAGRFDIKAGPTCNVHVSSLKDPDTGEFITNIATFPFFKSSNSTTQVQMWIGGNIAVSF